MSVQSIGSEVWSLRKVSSHFPSRADVLNHQAGGPHFVYLQDSVRGAATLLIDPKGVTDQKTLDEFKSIRDDTRQSPMPRCSP